MDKISFRKSHVVLILKLIFLELIVVFSYLLLRIPKATFFASQLNASNNQAFNIFGLIFFVVLSIIEMACVLQIVLDWSTEEFEIKEGSIVHRKGIFHLKQKTFTLRNLGSANIYQGLLGKIFNFGTIVITSPILKKDIVLPDIHNPQQILLLLEDNIEQKNNKVETIIPRKN